MAKCEEGYRCQVCGQDVAEMTESDLYLRYVLGMVDPEVLHTEVERHIRCNPALAQFIVDPDFEPVVCDNEFDKRQLDPDFVRHREQRVTRAWKRLHDMRRPGMSILEYPEKKDEGRRTKEGRRTNDE